MNGGERDSAWQAAAAAAAGVGVRSLLTSGGGGGNAGGGRGGAVVQVEIGRPVALKTRLLSNGRVKSSLNT